jgi:tetratricopeptide (TPR) repeat protein
MATWLSGRLEHERVLRELVPHLLECCPQCRQSHQEVLRLQEEVGHWDELVAVQESGEAVELFGELANLSFARQVQKVEEDERLHHWGLCQVLLRKSTEALADEPALALCYAELATRISRQLSAAYDIQWVLDLRARALAYIGNAQRVLGEVHSADVTLRLAEDTLALSSSGNNKVQAEVLAFKASLRRDQRLFADSLALSERALALFREVGDASGVAKSLIQRAKTLDESGDLESAIFFLRENAGEIERANDSRMSACAVYNLLCCLAAAGRFAEATSLLDEVRIRFEAAALPIDRIRLRWVEGTIRAGSDDLVAAEDSLLEARQAFLDRKMGYDAALVSLDLATLYARQGRTAELKKLAQELIPIFEAREIHREALASLLMFYRACEEERLTEELLRDLADALRRKQRQPHGV